MRKGVSDAERERERGCLGPLDRWDNNASGMTRGELNRAGNANSSSFVLIHVANHEPLMLHASDCGAFQIVSTRFSDIPLPIAM
ncbi:hypothetical protein J1N35_021434 [Gossypium stocksii]|uniref:Uncharacterized protein n=1 Tax=Gossypium stocksii TaxID=47602 RepID=A0A9D3VEQ6_9ROSI|nr:hypothetical protein J1N35_021434 [Gossypium stocksii]